MKKTLEGINSRITEAEERTSNLEDRMVEFTAMEQNKEKRIENNDRKDDPNLGNRMEKIQETFNKGLEELKSKQTEMNNTINEIKNSLEGINSRITEAEEWVSDLEDKIVEI